MRALIVDDDTIGSRVLAKFLSPYGQCDLVTDGLEAINAFVLASTEKRPYDVVFLDIMMPEVNGIDVLKAIRGLEEERGIAADKGVKVIMTTAMNDADVILESFSARCDGYIVKPIRKEQLFEEIRNLGFLPETPR